MLSTRRGTILKSIVGQYIMKAAPVASQYIVADHDLRVSPATVRNEMARLEEEGYIIRQHSSAGSVPSDKGYRYYVESLGEIELPLTEQRMISHLFHQVEKELEEWLKLAAKLLSQLVQNMAIVSTPKTTRCQFKCLDLVSLHDRSALGIFVLRGAKIKQRIITFEENVSQPRLTEIANKMNHLYADLTHKDIPAVKMELSTVEAQLSDYIVKIMQAEDNQEFDEPFLDGLHFMLNQPEFNSARSMKSLMELIDHRRLLKIIIPATPTDREIRVFIGKENQSEAIQDYSVVIGRYGLQDEAVGTIGVIGPTRMPYARAISTVSYISSVLSHLATDLYERDCG